MEKFKIKENIGTYRKCGWGEGRAGRPAGRPAGSQMFAEPIREPLRGSKEFHEIP